MFLFLFDHYNHYCWLSTLNPYGLSTCVNEHKVNEEIKKLYWLLCRICQFLFVNTTLKLGPSSIDCLYVAYTGVILPSKTCSWINISHHVPGPTLQSTNHSPLTSSVRRSCASFKIPLCFPRAKLVFAIEVSTIKQNPQ